MKNLLRCLTFVLMVGGAYAQSNLPACQGSGVWKWSNCFGNETFDDGRKYIGEYNNGKFSGQGTYTYANGDMYVGQFKDGRRSGQGTEIFPDGIKYIGEWKDGMRNGRGTLSFPNGNKYVGEWKENSPIGKTLYISSSYGSVYGTWVDGNFIPLEQLQQVTAPNQSMNAPPIDKKTQQLQVFSQSTATSNLGKRIALVIGNANYNSAPLKNPLNDAADISATLKQSGFEVIDQRNATLQEMSRGIREFGDKLLKSDVGLVYYSGHGLEVKGRNYLLPVNASMIREDEIAFQAIDANLILEKMNTAKKSVNILIVDACRDNPFARSFRSVNRGLAQMDAPTGTIVSFSTAPGKTASDGDGRNSPFTKNLVKAMMRTDMPIEAMFKEVRKSVVEETKGQQTPWESSSLIGDFYFKVSK